MKSASAQADRVLPRLRAHPVRQKRDTQNTIRGLPGSMGVRLAKGSGRFSERVRKALDGRPELRAAIAPPPSSLASVRVALRRADAAVAARAKAEGACRLSMTTPGVGPAMALAFASAVGAPERFAKSRAVGAYGSGVAALAIRGGGPFGPHLAARRRDVAQPSLRVCELPAGAGAARASVEGLGAAGEEADRPQEGARGAGAAAGGGPAPHDGRRRGVPLAEARPAAARAPAAARVRLWTCGQATPRLARMSTGATTRKKFSIRRARRFCGSARAERAVPAGTAALAIPFPGLQAGRHATGNARRTMGRQRQRPPSWSEPDNRPAKTPQTTMSPAERPQTQQRNPTEGPGTRLTAQPELDNLGVLGNAG